jgi:hypothetical protein
MSIFQIKLIAVIAMLIDHIGLWFFPEITTLRIIGRISFPLFAWLVANGVYHTHSIGKYIGRLFIFALLSQVPYFLLNSPFTDQSSVFNIFFTLLISLSAIFYIRKVNNKFLWIVIIFMASVAAEILRFEYGAAGVVTVIFFYLFFNNPVKLLFSQILIYLSFYLVPVLERVYTQTTNAREDYWFVIQGFSIISLLFIYLYNGKLGIKAKYFFYFFYPLHLLVIYLVQTYV